MLSVQPRTKGDGGKAASRTPPEIDADTVSRVMDVATVRYDKKGDDHYDVASAFIKSMRGSDPDASLHYLARMLRAGEDPRFIARRIMIAAAEEVGMAAPQVLQVTVAAIDFHRKQIRRKLGLTGAATNLRSYLLGLV